MTANTRSTIWTVALVAVFLFLIYKLWPALNRALNGGGGSGGGGAVGSFGGDDFNPDFGGYPYSTNPLQNLLGNLASSAGNLFGFGNSGSGSLYSSNPNNSLTNADYFGSSEGRQLQELGYTWDGADQLAPDDSDSWLNNDQITGSEQVPQNFDFGTFGFSPDDGGGDGGDSGDGGGD